MKYVVAVLVVVGSLISSLAQAQEPAPADPKAAARQELVTGPEPAMSMEEWIQQVKNPTPWLSWGADLRLREVYFNNAIFLDQSRAHHERHFQRFRARWWATVKPFDTLAINTRLTWEGRHYEKPTNFDEWYEGTLVVDHLNVRIDKLADLPLSVQVGRQDIILGDGWLVLEGTPLDGSRTIYFDAARATWNAKDINTTFDLIYIDQAGADDRWLNGTGPDEDQIEQDERGVILWVTHTGIEKTQINGYFMYKHMEALDGVMRTASGSSFPSPGDDADLYTVGGRIVRDLDEHWQVTLEGAAQFGSKNAASVLAGGAIGRLVYAFNDDVNGKIRFAYEYLSGNDPDTATNEQFDSLWGRWPQWSELYVYTYAGETRIADVTNLHRVGIGYVFNPTKATEICLDYHLVMGAENSLAGTAGFSDDGLIRGHLVTAVLKHKFNPHISGHLLGEVLFPGDYYDSPRDDVACFLRAELNFTF